jgi:hypothetical protein
MVTLSTWWLGLTLACCIIMTLVMTGLLGGIIFTLAKADKLLTMASEKGLPQLLGLTEQVNTIARRVDNIARQVDEESHVALPKVEHMLDTVDHTMEIVEARTEKVNEMLDSTRDNLKKVRQSPLTKQVLMGAGSLAAARLIQSTVHAYKHRTHTGNGHTNGQH